MIKIPNTNKQWAYSTESDIMGNVVNCHNITFDKQGYATLNSKMGEVTGDDANIDTVNSFVLNGSSVNAVTSDLVHESTPSLSLVTPIFARKSGAVAAGASSNGLFWKTKTHYADLTAIRTWDGTTSTSVITGLTSLNYHPICVYEYANSLVVGNGNEVHIYSDAYVKDTTNILTIPSIYTVIWIKIFQNNIYIGTVCNTNENAKVFVWNGTGTRAQSAWDSGGIWSFAGEIYQSSVVQVNSRGQLMLFTGSGFKELAALPVFYTQQMWRDSTGFLGGKVLIDGLKVDGDNIYINLDGEVTVSEYENGKMAPRYIPEQPSGIWCYDPKVGLYPFALISSDPIQDIAISSVDTGTNTITVSAHTFKTGDKVRYSHTGTAIGGLVNLKNYFIIKVSGTEFKLAETYDLAIAGTAVDLTSSGASGRVMGYTHKDFGASNITRGGAIGLQKEIQAVPHSIYSRYLLTAGYTVKSDLGERHSICSLQKNENRGSLTTPKIHSNAIQDNMRMLTVKYNGLTDGNDNIILKYRSGIRTGMPYCTLNTPSDYITWSDTTIFSVTSNDFGAVRSGDEIFVLSGAGAGYMVHISTITPSGTTYTVVIDEAIPSVTNGDKSHILVQDFTKVSTVTNTHELADKGYFQYPIGDVSKWFQFKLELRGEGIQIEEIGLDQKVNKA